MDKLVEKYGTSRHGHSIFAPSASAMWLNCSGSLLLHARSGDTAGMDAAMGTVAHTVAEAWHKTGEAPRYLLGTTMMSPAGGKDWPILIDETMLYHVGRYVEWCDEVPGDHYYEQKVDLSSLMPIPGQGGTADHFACEPGKLTITDFKHGMVRVYAERNSQAMLYAAGVFLEWDWIYGFQSIVIRICQPRLDVFDVWECTRADLLEFMEYVKVRAKAAWDENATRTPSPKACQWCPGKVDCPARTRDLDAIVDDTFNDLCAEDSEDIEYSVEQLAASVGRLPSKETWDKLELPVKPLTTDALAYTLTFRHHVESWFKAIHEELLDRAERGQKVPFFKLTDGRMRRNWKDKDDAIEFITEEWGIDGGELMPPKLLSVAQAEKLILTKTKGKKKDVKLALLNVVNEFAGKRTLAPLRDDRPVVDDLADDLETEDDDL